MGTTLPLNEKDGEISLSRLGERRVSASESLKNNDIFQKFDETGWDDGGESLKKNPCICRRAQLCIHPY